MIDVLKESRNIFKFYKKGKVTSGYENLECSNVMFDLGLEE
jgi:hypothetical protein